MTQLPYTFCFFFAFINGNFATKFYEIILPSNNQSNVIYDNIEPIGECSEMQRGTENLNETAVALIRKALDTVSFEANHGEFAWVIEVYNSTWFSTCNKAHLHEESQTFQCSIRAINLCFTHWNHKTEEIMQAA